MFLFDFQICFAFFYLACSDFSKSLLKNKSTGVTDTQVYSYNNSVTLPKDTQ